MSGGKSSAAILAEAARLLRCRVVGRREFDGDANERPFGTACAECGGCVPTDALITSGMAFTRTGSGLEWECPSCGTRVHEVVDGPSIDDAARIVADPLCVNCRKNGMTALQGCGSRPLAGVPDVEAP